MSSKEHKEFIWNLIKDIKVGMLVTQESDENDSLRARPMTLVQDVYDGTLYFFTPKDDSKVYEVAKEKKEVCLTFSDGNEQVYVSLSGKASLNSDKSLIDKFWNPWVAAWFPKGKDDPNLTLLEVKVYKGQHWDAKENKFHQLFEIAKANITDTEPEIGDSVKFG